MEQNQYPSGFVDPIIYRTIEKIITTKNKGSVRFEDIIDGKKLFIIQYRGHETDKFISKLIKMEAPIFPVFTMKKLKTVLPSLKEPTPKMLLSNIVYKMNCSRCESCYVGYTTRHTITRCSEHRRGVNANEAMKEHKKRCNTDLWEGTSVQVLDRTNRGLIFLSILEALHIRDHKPDLNVRDEFRGRTLRIKI